MNKTQKTAIKNAIKKLQIASMLLEDQKDIVANHSLSAAILSGAEAFDCLVNGFPDIVEEIQTPLIDNQNQLKFNFMVDNSQTTDTVNP
jgi:hypothetical protein